MSLENKKKQLMIKRAETAKFELELKIEERKEDIKRIEEHIKLQDEIIEKLTKELE